MRGSTSSWKWIRGRPSIGSVSGYVERLNPLIGFLVSTLHLPGDIIECGVYRGESVQWISRAFRDHAPEKRVRLR